VFDRSFVTFVGELRKIKCLNIYFMPKCSKCDNEAEYYFKENNKIIYLCREHAKEFMFENNVNFLSRIKVKI